MSSQLDKLVGKRVVVEVQDPNGDDPIHETEGKLLMYSQNGFALETKEGTLVIEADFVVDIHETTTTSTSKIVRRNLRGIPESQARQHLLDRHAMPWDLIKVTIPFTAFQLHSKIDHSGLGHHHREGE